MCKKRHFSDYLNDLLLFKPWFPFFAFNSLNFLWNSAFFNWLWLWFIVPKNVWGLNFCFIFCFQKSFLLVFFRPVFPGRAGRFRTGGSSLSSFIGRLPTYNNFYSLFLLRFTSNTNIIHLAFLQFVIKIKFFLFLTCHLFLGLAYRLLS